MFASMKPLLGRFLLLQFKKYLVKTIIPSATDGPCIQNLYIHTVDSTIWPSGTHQFPEIDTVEV